MSMCMFGCQYERFGFPMCNGESTNILCEYDDMSDQEERIYHFNERIDIFSFVHFFTIH